MITTQYTNINSNTTTYFERPLHTILQLCFVQVNTRKCIPMYSDRVSTHIHIYTINIHIYRGSICPSVGNMYSMGQ